MSWILEMDKPKQNILAWLPHSTDAWKVSTHLVGKFFMAECSSGRTPTILYICPIYFSPSSFVYISLIKIEWSILDNAPNYLLGCNIQKRFHFSLNRPYKYDAIFHPLDCMPGAYLNKYRAIIYYNFISENTISK